MARRSRSRKAKSDDRRTGILLAILGVVILSALVGAFLWVKRTKIPLDQATNCPRTGPRAVHVVLFDRTDPISPLQGQRIRQKMNELRDAAPFGKRFDIYTV